MRYPPLAPADHRAAVEITGKTAALPHRPDRGMELYAPSARVQSSLPAAHLPPQSTPHTPSLLTPIRLVLQTFPSLYFPSPLQLFWETAVSLYVGSFGLYKAECM